MKSLATIVADYIRDTAEEREPDGLLHPSAMYGCDRRAVYGLRGVPQTEPPDDRALGIFRQGHNMHDFVQQALRWEWGDEVISEVPVRDEGLGLTGHADAVKVSDPGMLYELKSINSRALQYSKELPKEDHVSQAESYLSILRRVGSVEMGLPPMRDLRTITYGYINKDTFEVSEFVVEYDDNMLREATARLMDTAERLMGYEGLPPRLPKVNGKKAWQCGYCPWATQCWKVDPA